MEADKTVAQCVAHFTKRDKYRRDTQQYLKATMEANVAARKTPTITGTNAYSATPAISKTDLWTYCWSHGITKHDSRACQKPKPGHITEATMANRQGGSDYTPGPRGKGNRRKQDQRAKRQAEDEQEADNKRHK